MRDRFWDWFTTAAPRVVAGAELPAILRRSSSSGAVCLLLAGATGATARSAAERAAAEARVRLLRVNLKALGGPYAAEAEKSIDVVFAAAAQTGAALLFENADALFGRSGGGASAEGFSKRLDAFRGNALFALAAAPRALDSAFSRRLAYVVDLQPPDAKQRDSLWRSVLPG